MTSSTPEPHPIDLAAGYVLDDLSPREAAQLERALAEEPALSRDIAAFEEAFSLMPYALPMVEPGAGLKAKILSAADQSLDQPIAARSGTQTTPPSNVVPMGVWPRRRGQRWMPVLSTAIAAVAVAALGVSQVQLRQQSQRAITLQQEVESTTVELVRLRDELQASQGAIAQLSQSEAQSYALVGAMPNPNNAPVAKARIFAKPGDRAVTLVAQDLPRLPESQIYRLWAVATPTAAPMYCGQFRQDDQGTAQWIAPSPVCTQNPAQLLITLDGPTDPTTSAGPLVLKSAS